MRKRIFCFMLCLLLMLPCAGLAMNDGAVVTNPNPAERLNIRQRPDISSASLGKYYTGTSVTILEYREDDWQKVGIGHEKDGGYQIVGYAMKKFLTPMFDGAEQNVKSAMPEYTASEGQWTLYSRPTTNSSRETYGDGMRIRVMGIMGNWWHVGIVQDGDIGITGFVPAGGGGDPSDTSAYTAVVKNPNPADRLNLRLTANAASKSLGKYYNGVQVQVLSFHVNGTWAKVRIGKTEGYMMAGYLATGSDGSQVKSVIPTVRLTTDKVNLRETASLTGKVLGQYRLGTAVKVWGVGDTWMHVHVDGKTGYILASLMEAVPGEGGGGTSTPAPVTGRAAKLTANANFRQSGSYSGAILAFLGKGTKVTVQKQSGDWYYVRIGTTDAYGWILRTLVGIE